jgi:MFS family permease
MTILFSLGLTPVLTTMAASLVMVAVVFFAMPGVTNSQHSEATPHFMMPTGIILVLSILAAVIFMVEGAMLDWGALLMLAKGNIDIEHSGIAYMLFAIAMTFGRFYGDRLTSRIGDFNTVLWGGLTVLLGLVLIIACQITVPALFGFFLVGCGASNIVPVLFRQAGRQKIMPMALAVAYISTLGYSGILVGPAIIGFIAEATSLHISFIFLALVWSLVPLLSRRATQN